MKRTWASCGTALTSEAAAVKDRAGLMRLAEKLYQWKTEMAGERH